ncbi:MAG: GspH/FimT family pseudopilin [Pseudomonadota bacterium]
MRTNKQTGVTMMEMLIVVAIAAILATIAGPSFGDFVNNTRLNSTMTQLASDLNRARIEAIKRNSWMLICVSNAAGTDCGTGANWQNGWAVCLDSEPDGSCDASTTDQPNPITVHQPLNTNLMLTGTAAAIRFNPNGTQGTGAVATLTLCCKSNSSPNTSVASIAATGHISRQ